MPDLVSAFAALAAPTSAILGDAEAPYALILQNKRSIGTIAIDVPIREVHDDTFVITQNPSMAGYAVADGYFASPCRVEITCGFSDSTAQYVGYSQDVYQAFLALVQTKQPFSVVTGKRLYENMMVENISVRTDPSSEYALDITVRLQEFIIAQTSGGDTSSFGATNDNQAQPQQTGPETDVGKVSLQPWNGPGMTPIGTVAGGV